MGSLSSRPSVPTITASAPQVVYVSNPATDTQSSTASEAVQAEEEKSSAAQQRQKGLLRRSRGILGTVTTGLRGLLATQDTAPQRKTLLGE